MKGTLWGIGIGPGDPELVTVKAARILGACRHVVAPSARTGEGSLALSIASPHLGPEAKVHEVEFPMTSDRALREARWQEAARLCLELLEEGDVAFPTLGDASLYSTWIYLARAVRSLDAQVRLECVPGVTSFCAAAARTGRVLAEEGQILTVVPAAGDEPLAIAEAVGRGSAVLMKVGRRIATVVQALDEAGALERSVLVSRASLPEERVVRDLSLLRDAQAEYLSVVLVEGVRP